MGGRGPLPAVRYRRPVAPVNREQLDAMVEEATVDCHDAAEQVRGFFTVIEEHLVVPFGTQVLGVDVSVDSVELAEDDQIVAVCSRGHVRQAIPILYLPLPSPPPDGTEWVEAYRFWATGTWRT
jgi:hypothetical protein